MRSVQRGLPAVRLQVRCHPPGGTAGSRAAAAPGCMCVASRGVVGCSPITQWEEFRLSAGLEAAGQAADAGRRPEPIRVLIVDDHALFRRGLEMVLEEEDDIDLVGQACHAIQEAVPSTMIVMLTISDEEEDLFEAIRAGASGYLLKDIPLDEVAEAVRSVHGGQSLISPFMAGKLLTEFATLGRRTDDEPVQQVPAPKLTDREMEVLKLVAKGMNNRDIARELFISENTVKNHVRNILEKLQIHSRMEAVMIALRDKLIDIG